MRSLIQVVNPYTQAVAVDGGINLGSVIRRFGCNLRLSGNAIEASGEGYYTIDGAVTVEPTGAGPVSVGVFANGVQLAGAISSGTGAAASPITLPIVGTIRNVGCSDTNLSLVLLNGAGNVTNVSLRVEKA